MNKEKKLLKDICKWRKRFDKAAYELKMARHRFLAYRGEQACPDFIDKAEITETVEEVNRWLKQH